MKTKQLLLSFVAVAFLGGASFFLLNDDVDRNNSVKKYQVRENLTSETSQYDANGAAEWISQRRVNPATGTISAKDIEQARKSFALSEQNKSVDAGDMNWEFMGPDNVGGRTRGFILDNRDNKTLWAGGVAGGLWKSTTNGLSWIPIGLDDMDNITISSICQDTDGNIYVGTGEYFSGGNGDAMSTPGFRGGGIWKSIDGITFDRLESTNDVDKFDYVNELICDPSTNNLYAATNYGVLLSTDGGVTWNNPYVITGIATDVKISTDGTVVFSMVSTTSSGYILDAYVFVSKNGEEPVNKEGQFDTEDSFDRMELAISPSDPNYMYALCSYKSAVDKYFNLYQSTDAGENWSSVIINHTTAVDVFRGNSQGSYDNVIAVFPDNPGEVIFGGIDLWTWSEENAFEQISFWMEFAGEKFVHADQHNIYFHPDYANNSTIYFTNDGGIFASYNSATTFIALNKNYGVTQFYAIDCGPNGEVLGGTQDNGSPYIDLLQTSAPASSREITGGDGGYSAISELYPGAIFSTIYRCRLYRSNENGAGATMQEYPFDNNGAYSTKSQLAPENLRNPFVTPIDMWESFDYDSSRIYIPFEVDTIIEITSTGVPDTIVEFGEGYTFLVQSTVVENKLFEYTLTADDIVNNGGDFLRPGDKIAIRERFASLMAIGGAGDNASSGKLFITREMLNFKDEYPNWDALVSGLDHINEGLGIEGIVNVKWAPDGNSLYAVGAKVINSNNNLSDFSLFRFTGIQEAYNYSGPVYENRTITQDTTYGVLSADISDVTLLESSPINVWSVTYSGTTENRVVAFDTTYISNILNLHLGSLESCDIVFDAINEDSISVSTTNTVNHNIYSIETSSSLTYNFITSVDTVYPVNHYMLDLISLNFNTCTNDTAKDFNSDSIFVVTPLTFDYLLDSVFTTNLFYTNVYSYDSVFLAGPDTTINLVRMQIVSGACVLDTVFDVNNDTITHFVSYNNVLNYDSIVSITSTVYDNIVKIDTLSVVYDTLLNIVYKDTADGACNMIAVNDINIDTVISLQLLIEPYTYYDITLNDGANYNNILDIDTTANGPSIMNIVSQDSTYGAMGVIGHDMVWNNREVNTIQSVVGVEIKDFGWGVPTSITIDPNNTENLVVTVGGYGTLDRVYFTDNATTATDADFVVVDGIGLPDAPIYSSLFSDTKPDGTQDLLILGTEYGVYSTSIINGSSTQWVRETAIPKVPVFHMTQQLQPNGYIEGVCETGVRNSGVIYAGTHGLGAWKMDKYARPYTAIEEIKPEKVDALMVKVYPNPVKLVANVEYSVTETSNVEIAVYSLTGKLVYRQTIANQYKGTHVHKINAEGFSNGVYVISLTSNNERKVSKFIVE